MYRAISESLHKELTKKDDFNRVDVSRGNYNKTTEIRNKMNNKIEFLMKLRKAVNKNDAK